MKTRVHAAAGMLGLAMICTFWASTVLSELLGAPETVAAVKAAILKGMVVLIPAMIVAAASGRSLASGRSGTAIRAKARRMPMIALNGVLILVPSAVFLALQSSAGNFDAWFCAVQAIELIAGGANVTLMALNIRDGLRLTGRLRRRIHVRIP